MINMPELARARVGHPSDVLSVDRRVRARVVNICSDRGRVSLSLRDVTGPDTSAASPPSA
ncbi:S1 RNA-binding domain-containing protein [Streptomyces lonarensis]|uniref:S1 RNA-binding domain-containing protein n=1 Tax=Streptomyces lonarensis TaxID=700599 RepID=A0A7X6CZQ8_9ACTN|nr:S1 RNA-binding domain-containing protein [Streptomyces lonarensis]NJQ05510.1 S1 RNA-binding domain-containing protein [Streptomyces lonarensis]